MKIAIIDACIFIELYELQLTADFFNLDIEVHTSVDVINELYDNQQQMLTAFKSAGKLTAHIIAPKNKSEIISCSYLKSLSESDKTVLYLAVKLGAVIISSSKTISSAAKNNSIGYVDMIWIFDELVKYNHITKETAYTKLKKSIALNLVFQNNKDLVHELENRLALWGIGS